MNEVSLGDAVVGWPERPPIARDLVCDDDVVSFYERLGGTRTNAVVWRNDAALTRANRE
jgi:hypothetical protein